MKNIIKVTNFDELWSATPTNTSGEKRLSHYSLVESEPFQSQELILGDASIYIYTF